MSQTLISTQSLASTATSITFSSIPQTFSELYVVMSLRSSDALLFRDVRVLANGSGSMTWRALYSDKGTVASNNFSEATCTFFINMGATSANATSSVFSNAQFSIPNYTSTSTKICTSDAITETNGTQGSLTISTSSVSNGAAVTSLTFTPDGGATSFQIGSTISIYGIK